MADAVDDPGAIRRFSGRSKLRDEMGGKPSPMGFDFTRSKDQAEDTMRGQMVRSQAISDAVPRRAFPNDGFAHQRPVVE